MRLSHRAHCLRAENMFTGSPAASQSTWLQIWVIFFTKTICCEVNVDCTVEQLEDNYTSLRWNWLNFVFLSAIGHKISQENEG